MIIFHFIWRFLKLVRGNGVISPSSCLDVLKIRMKMRENELNRQIYIYLKMDLQYWFMINLLDYIIMTIACNIFFLIIFF